MNDDLRRQIASELNKELEEIASLERQVAEATTIMDNAVSKVAEPHLKEIDKLKSSIQQKVNEVAKKANANRGLLTDSNKKKTIALRAGTISWRDSTSLVFDVTNARLLKLIGRLGKIRKFVIKKPTISKEAIERDTNFVTELINRGAAHFEKVENLTIKPFVADGKIIKNDNPYKITYPREE